MIFAMLKDSEPNNYYGWIPMFRKIKPEDFKKMKVKVFNDVYTEWNDEFVEAIQKDEMYDKLLYRHEE